MNLAYDWKRIITKAYSLRWAVVAVVFGGAELLLPIFIDIFPRHIFAILSLIAMIGSMWARVIRQKDYYE